MKKSKLFVLCSFFVFFACGKNTETIKEISNLGQSELKTIEDESYTDSLNQGHALSFLVNGAQVTTVLDEADTALRLFAPMQVNPIGGFNGAGTGNKALVGLEGFHSLKLSELVSVGFSYKQIKATALLYVNLQLDLNCNGLFDLGIDKIWAPSITPVQMLNFWYSYSVNRFTPGSLYPGGTSMTWQQVLNAHPNVCLFDGYTADGGMPKLASTKAIMTVLSDSSNNNHEKEVLIDNIKVLTEGRKIKSYNFAF